MQCTAPVCSTLRAGRIPRVTIKRMMQCSKVLLGQCGPSTHRGAINDGVSFAKKASHRARARTHRGSEFSAWVQLRMFEGDTL
jgi:hypothetical protein